MGQANAETPDNGEANAAADSEMFTASLSVGLVREFVREFANEGGACTRLADALESQLPEPRSGTPGPGGGFAYCESVGERLGERFECLEPAGHPLPHPGDLYWLIDDDGCPHCGRVDTHSTNCPEPEPLGPDNSVLHATEWDDDGHVTLTPDRQTTR